MDKFISYASNFEDVMLWRALRSVKSGFYIDVGAHHPTIDSVTRAFYERGWQGINIEPISHLHALLMQDRPRDININMAVSSFSGNMTFFDVVGTGLSTTNIQIAQRHKNEGKIVNEYQVPVTTLEEIYSAHNVTEVHFLKIDVEGAEAAVLKMGAFDKVRPWVVIVEATEPNTPIPSHARWEHLLVEAEFQPIYFDGVNRYYLSKDHPELADFFRVPPNVFDNFIQHQCWLAHKGLIEYEQYAKNLEKRIQKMSASWSWKLTKPFRAPFVLFTDLINRRNKD